MCALCNALSILGWRDLLSFTIDFSVMSLKLLSFTSKKKKKRDLAIYTLDCYNESTMSVCPSVMVCHIFCVKMTLFYFTVQNNVIFVWVYCMILLLMKEHIDIVTI